MDRNWVVVALLIGSGSLQLGCEVPQPEASSARTTDRGEPPREGMRRQRPKPTRADWHYNGVVSAVGPDWLELRAGWTAETGKVGNKQDNTKTKRISAVETTVGGDADGDGELETHRIIDLKVGDVVTIDTWEGADGSEWPTRLLITRRPGGKIPPLHGESVLPGEKPNNHLHLQAEQDWEEKGTPIPKKYLDPNGRAPWTNPPYPPVAPLPRPATPKP